MLQLSFNPFPVLQTQRLTLRVVTPDDAPEIFAFRSDKEAMRYVGKPPATSIDEATALIKLFMEGISSNTSITWGITFRDQDALIGTIGFWRIEKEHHRAEIGYMLHPGHWNKGIITEAVQAALEYGFRQMKLHSIEAQLTPENTGSVKVLEKTGFTKEAHFKENYFFEGVYSDTAVYSKLSPET